jgi:hypothetical protein
VVGPAVGALLGGELLGDAVLIAALGAAALGAAVAGVMSSSGRCQNHDDTMLTATQPNDGATNRNCIIAWAAAASIAASPEDSVRTARRNRPSLPTSSAKRTLAFVGCAPGGMVKFDSSTIRIATRGHAAAACACGIGVDAAAITTPRMNPSTPSSVHDARRIACRKSTLARPEAAYRTTRMNFKSSS